MTATSTNPPKPAGTISPQGVVGWALGFINGVVNQLFALTHTAAIMRTTLIWLLFFGTAFVLVAATRSAEQWSELLDFFSALLFPTVPLPNGEAATSAISRFFEAVFLNPTVWGHLIALYAPFWLMKRIAAIYLADIFEKEDNVARRFITQAAFATDYNTVRIREGKIIESDQDSPIVQIGGPGYVMVELDSAVLFERPDGTPHVVAPTVGEWHNRKIIEGFERIRQAADLREMMGNQEVSARSRDGIPVVAKDIQYSYSIYRGENPVKTLQTPYPFVEKAVESLAYKLPRPIKPGVAPSGKPDWLAALPGRINGPIQLELGSFINKHVLSEFLASIGEPEENALRSREIELDKMGQQFSGRNGNNAGEIFFKSGAFTSRSFITALFYDEEGFKKRAADRGFQVNWIGVGTWVTPTEIIPANHLEAWKISRENFLRNYPEELKKLGEDANLQENLRLIQTMPVGKFYNDSKKSDDMDLIDDLIGEYYERLLSAKEFYERDGLEVPVALEMAIRTLRDVRNLPPYYSVGGSG
jgi:hypothetical protein